MVESRSGDESHRRAYLTATMEGVSRSFALVVPCLEQPLQDYFATAYLLCRALDNIEDCSQPLRWQRQRFAEFTRLLFKPELAETRLLEWEAAAWPGLSADERSLMTVAGGLPLWSFYASFPPRTRAIMQNWIPLMAEGMEAVLDPDASPALVRGTVRVLETVQAYNDYCYSVAGTVGGMGTELVIDHYRLADQSDLSDLSDDVAATLLSGSEACGRALQKTNVVKDFADDLRRGVCYLPDEWLREIGHSPLELAGAPRSWISDVLTDILAELRSATSYIVTVPTRAAGYRVACLMCLLPAYETILCAARSRDLFTAGHQVKIARPVMARCAQSAFAMAGDDEAIARMGEELERAVLDALNE